MWACALALASIVFMSAPTVGQSTCYSPTALNFTSEAGKLWVNGQRFHLKGTSWFGFETAACTVHGLWANSYTFFLDFMAAQGFNAIRLPFHLELVLNEKSPNGINSAVLPTSAEWSLKLGSRALTMSCSSAFRVTRR